MIPALHRLLLVVAALSGLGLARSATAQELRLEIDRDAAASVGLDADEVEREYGDELNSRLNVDNQDDYMRAMANAAAMSARGMGVDYATNLEKFVFGGSFGSAVNAAGAQFGRGGDIPEGGFAFQMSLMAGMNLGMFGEEDSFWRRFRIFVNGMGMSTGLDPFTGQLLNLGAHGQFQLVRPQKSAALEWGGLSLTSGYDYSRYVLRLEQVLPIEQDDLRWDAEGQWEIQSEVSSVPIELSTNLRVLVATLYLGGALDINLDSNAISEASLAGDVEYTGGEGSTKIGEAEVSLDSSAWGSLYTPRVFTGLQLNLLWVKLYGQLNLGLDRSFGGHAGLRIAK